MRSIGSIPGVAPLMACAALLLAWEGAARAIGIDGLPPASQALAQIPAILGDPESLLNIADSVRRMVVGFALALCVAIPVVLTMGRSRQVAAFFNPLLMVIYPGVTLPVIYHSYQGSRAVEEKILWSAAAMGMGSPARLARIVLPAALPEILVGCRTGLVLALITMVTSEMIARQTGVGNILFNSLDMAQYDTVYAMIVIIGVLGYVLDFAFEGLRSRLVGWAEPSHDIVAGTT